MALSASESINSGLRTVVIAVLSATIPHRSTTTPKTKHTHRHASQWEKISYVVCIQGFHNSTDSVLLFLFLLLFCTDLSFCYWCHTLWNHKTRDRIWESCYSGSQILSCPVVSTLWLSMTARWGSIKWALVKTNDKRSAVGGLQRSEVQVVQDVVLMYSVMFKIIIHAISNSQHIFTAK